MIIEDKLELCERTLNNRHFVKVINKDAQSSTATRLGNDFPIRKYNLITKKQQKGCQR